MTIISASNTDSMAPDSGSSSASKFRGAAWDFEAAVREVELLRVVRPLAGEKGEVSSLEDSDRVEGEALSRFVDMVKAGGP